MIEIETALKLIAENTPPLVAERVPLHMSQFQVLAENVASDIDSPPFDKSMMDGYAVHADDLGEAETSLDLAGTLMAGESSAAELARGKCLRIMTGAMIPTGANAVVPREQTDDPPSDGERQRVTFRCGIVAVGTNVLKRGCCMKQGQTVLTKGGTVRSAEIGLMAEMGHLQVLVHPQPKAAVIATGSELVTVDQKPTGAKLRNTNGPMVSALLRGARAHGVNLGIAPDQPQQLKQLILKGLRYDLLVLTGGVSVGDLDLVPKMLKEVGVQQIFHGVNLKPGKPVWFGRSPDGKIVFGLPGNPVSSYVCCQLFVRTAIGHLRGSQTPSPTAQTGILQHDFEVSGRRRTLWPGRFQPREDLPVLELLPWKGSADLLTWTEANCMVDLPAPGRLQASTPVKFIELDM